jgi:hypothetical protein
MAKKGLPCQSVIRLVEQAGIGKIRKAARMCNRDGRDSSIPGTRVLQPHAAEVKHIKTLKIDILALHVDIADKLL